MTRSSGKDRHEYTAASANIYSSIGIEGTTYEIGFDLLGDIKGNTFLDFGCGTGRSTAILKALGAGHVYGVDHDQDMLDVALARGGSPQDAGKRRNLKSRRSRDRRQRWREPRS